MGYKEDIQRGPCMSCEFYPQYEEWFSTGFKQVSVWFGLHFKVSSLATLENELKRGKSGSKEN